METDKKIIISQKIENKILGLNRDIVQYEICSDFTKINLKSDCNLVVFFIDISDLAFLKANVDSSVLYSILLFNHDNDFTSISEDDFKNISQIYSKELSSQEFNFQINKIFHYLKEKRDHSLECKRLKKSLDDTKHDQEDLINIGRALSLEKDPESLLRLILFLSKKITGADAGSIYLVEEDANNLKRLRFKYSHTFSREIPLEEFVMDLDKCSIAGYVAVTGAVVNLPDVYKLAGEESFSFNSSFDKKHNYITRSMLVVPMRNHLDEIIGVIQLINSKEGDFTDCEFENVAFGLKLETESDFNKYVNVFNSKYDSLMEAVAGQAAVSIENSRMIKQIQYQFEEFVKASVHAIESRDPATSGHSFRVASLCKEMALAINDQKEGVFSEIYFDENGLKELEYAALLHDFGKVYIDLAIFMKAKKLFPSDFNNLLLRINLLYRSVELNFYYKIRKIQKSNVENSEIEEKINLLVAEQESLLQKIEDLKSRLIDLNEPTLFREDPKLVIDEIVETIKEFKCYDIDNNEIDIITETDRLNLAIKRGSLNPIERKEIESHVEHTNNFVSKIPWPPEYKNIPEIASKHHEVLDGSGYPNGISGKENIMLQSRIMTVADIYDALTASDRPYKKAVPIARVIKILQEEADKGKLDDDIIKLFIEKEIYNKNLDYV